MASSSALNSEIVSAKVKTLMNNQLKTILKREGLPVSGAKAAMQTRIINSESRSQQVHDLINPSKNYCIDEASLAVVCTIPRERSRKLTVPMFITRTLQLRGQ